MSESSKRGIYQYIDKTFTTKIDDVQKIKTGINMVLVKPILDTEKLSNGLYMDTSFQELECASRVVEVVKLPESLAIKGDKCYSSVHLFALDWSTDMDLCIGDIAWVDPLHVVLNNHTFDTHAFVCKGELYYLIRYDKFIAKKSNDQVTMLNGYVLLEPEFVDGGWGTYNQRIPTGHAIVRYVGKPNHYYYERHYQDNIDMKEGDRVLLPKNLVWLESELYAQFEGDKMFVVTQRKNLSYLIDPDGSSLDGVRISPGKLIVEMKHTQQTKSGLFLPINKQTDKNRGIIVRAGSPRSGEDKLSEGDAVVWAKTERMIGYNERPYVVLDSVNILVTCKDEEMTLDGVKIPPGKILVKRNFEEVTASGIHLPADAQVNPYMGVIVKMGSYRDRDYPIENLQAGDEVYFISCSKEVLIDNYNYVLVDYTRLAYALDTNKRTVQGVRLPPGFVLIERDITKKTDTGIVLPISKQQSKNSGTVVRIGPLREDFDNIEDLKEGNRVYFSKFSQEAELQGKEYVIIDSLNLLLFE